MHITADQNLMVSAYSNDLMHFLAAIISHSPPEQLILAAETGDPLHDFVAERLSYQVNRSIGFNTVRTIKLIKTHVWYLIPSSLCRVEKVG